MGKLEAGDRCGCASEGLKTLHRSTFSLDRTMVLFNDVVEIFATAYLYVFPIDVFFSEQTQRPMAGFVAIKRHFFRQSPSVGCNGLAKKVLGGGDAAGLAQIEVNGSTLFIYRAIQVLPLTFDVDEGFINPPRRAH